MNIRDARPPVLYVNSTNFLTPVHSELPTEVVAWHPINKHEFVQCVIKHNAPFDFDLPVRAYPGKLVETAAPGNMITVGKQSVVPRVCVTEFGNFGSAKFKKGEAEAAKHPTFKFGDKIPIHYSIEGNQMEVHPVVPFGLLAQGYYGITAASSQHVYVKLKPVAEKQQVELHKVIVCETSQQPEMGFTYHTKHIYNPLVSHMELARILNNIDESAPKVVVAAAPAAVVNKSEMAVGTPCKCQPCKPNADWPVGALFSISRSKAQRQRAAFKAKYLNLMKTIDRQLESPETKRAQLAPGEMTIEQAKQEIKTRQKVLKKLDGNLKDLHHTVKEYLSWLKKYEGTIKNSERTEELPDTDKPDALKNEYAAVRKEERTWKDKLATAAGEIDGAIKSLRLLTKERGQYSSSSSSESEGENEAKPEAAAKTKKALAAKSKTAKK